MDLCMPGALCEQYKSRAQQARVVTEAWASTALYCASCESSSLQSLSRNAPGADLQCEVCEARYQLKSSNKPFGRRVVDSAYSAMVTAIESDTAPNLLLLHYDASWSVSSLILVPRFCFTIAAIQKRKPLGPLARRAGWVGCNILLDAIPPDAKIAVVRDAEPSTAESVRAAYDRLRPLTLIQPTLGGWALNVFNFARTLCQDEFSLTDLYAFEGSLRSLYPNNKNIRPKIRQQLQVLRDAGLLEFIGRGRYRFTN